MNTCSVIGLPLDLSCEMLSIISIFSIISLTEIISHQEQLLILNDTDLVLNLISFRCSDKGNRCSVEECYSFLPAILNQCIARKGALVRTFHQGKLLMVQPKPRRKKTKNSEVRIYPNSVQISYRSILFAMFYHH